MEMLVLSGEMSTTNGAVLVDNDDDDNGIDDECASVAVAVAVAVAVRSGAFHTNTWLTVFPFND